MQNVQFQCRICQQTNQSQNQKNYQFQTVWGMIPHLDKKNTGGEDAIYISKNVLAIADGVSGWHQYGVDPGVYSKKLMEAIAKILSVQENLLHYISKPIQLAKASVKMVQQQGSTTLTILTVHPTTGTLRSYQIGDSLFSLFEDSSCKYMGKEQEHSFNWPYQIGNGMNSSQDQFDRYGDINNGIYRQFSWFQIQNKLLLSATDGLWDNLNIGTISKCIQKNSSNDQCNKSKNCKKIIKNLIASVQATWKLQEYHSPFYHKATSSGFQCQKKAKIDDLTILLTKIVAKKQPANRTDFK